MFDLAGDQVVKSARIMHSRPGRVVDGDLDPRIDRVAQIADPDEHSRVAPFGQLVVEIEHEVADLALVNQEVAPRAMRIEAFGLNEGLG